MHDDDRALQDFVRHGLLWIWWPHVDKNPALRLFDFDAANLLQIMEAGSCSHRDTLWGVALIMLEI